MRPLVISALSLVASIAHANPIALQNFSGFTDQDIQEAVTESFSSQYIQTINAKKLALFVLTDSSASDEGIYCVSIVGLTRETAKGLNPRLPKMRGHMSMFFPGDLVKKGNLTASACKAAVLDRTLKAMNGNPSVSMAHIDETENSGGKRKTLPANSTLSHTVQSSVSPDSVENAIHNVISSTNFSATFDYRSIGMTTLSSSTIANDMVICYAVSGLTMRAPEGRLPRFPGYRLGYFRHYDIDRTSRGREAKLAAQCEANAASDAVAALLDKQWNENGILKNLSYTREQGVDQVTSIRN